MSSREKWTAYFIEGPMDLTKQIVDQPNPMRLFPIPYDDEVSHFSFTSQHESTSLKQITCVNHEYRIAYRDSIHRIVIYKYRGYDQ